MNGVVFNSKSLFLKNTVNEFDDPGDVDTTVDESNAVVDAQSGVEDKSKSSLIAEVDKIGVVRELVETVI